jgi:hypothetical protein
MVVWMLTLKALICLLWPLFNYSGHPLFILATLCLLWPLILATFCLLWPCTGVNIRPAAIRHNNKISLAEDLDRGIGSFRAIG